MPETEFLVLTVRARELADQIARREGVAAAEIVARALEAYAERAAEREPAEAFYRRLNAERGEDIDLDALIQDHRRPHCGIDLSGHDRIRSEWRLRTEHKVNMAERRGSLAISRKQVETCPAGAG